MSELEFSPMQAIRAKRTPELLDMYRHKVDYSEETIDIVVAELDAREVSLDQVEVDPETEQERDEKVQREKTKKSDIVLAKAISVLHIIGGGSVACLAGIACFVGLFRSGEGVPLLMLLLLPLGISFVVLGFSIWRLRKWALITAIIVYTGSFILNIVDLFFATESIGLIGTIRVIFSIVIAITFVRLVKEKVWQESIPKAHSLKNDT